MMLRTAGCGAVCAHAYVRAYVAFISCFRIEWQAATGKAYSVQAQSLAALPHMKTHLLRFMSIAGNVPSKPRPICIMSLVVTTATTLLRAD